MSSHSHLGQSYVEPQGRFSRRVIDFQLQEKVIASEAGPIYYGMERTEYFDIEKLWERFEAFMRERGDASLRDVLMTAYEDYVGEAR